MSHNSLFFDSYIVEHNTSFLENSILHGQNSTATPVWHPNPTVRGTWNIYQTCIVGKFGCTM